MSKKLIFLAAILFSTAALAQTIDDFESYPVGKFPSKWRTWPFQRGKAASVYKVAQENGNKFLSAFDDRDISVQTLRDFGWDLERSPVLTWKWRAKTLPVNANETDPATNDSACGVYVVISKARQEMIKYTWSTKAPVGTSYEKRAGKAFIVVLDSGDAKLGKWIERKVNVAEDYQKFFGRKLDRDPVAIAILTDGNATHSDAACDYDNFAVSAK